MSSPTEKVNVRVEDRVLTLSNLTKVLYPDVGFTKSQVIDYYVRVAPILLPHITDRPLTLKRFPDGVDGKSFYQKNAPDHTPDWVRTELISSPGSSRERDEVRYVIAGDLPTLVWAANLANLEIHTPQWRVPHKGEPDLLVFDLDPGPPANIVQCCQVALLLRPLLEEHAMVPFAKTSGSKGMQLITAIDGVTSAEASDLVRGFAEQLERAEPRLVVSRMTKQLRPGKVLIDWSQNNGAKTTVAPYSLRAMSRPTVSTPITWDEVAECTSPDELVFTSADVLQRIERDGDLLAGLVG